MNKQEANEIFQDVKLKMLNNWKVKQDNKVSKDSTPNELFGYAADCHSEGSEQWMFFQLQESVICWASQHKPMEGGTSEERIDHTVKAFNKFFKIP